MTTLFDATLALARILGNVRNSTTTAAGSATTIVDSTRTEPADFWNDGTIWITSGTDIGKSRKITDWALSGTTFTVPTMTSAPGSGVTYSVIVGDWPQDKLWEFINAALREMGDVPQVNTATTTVAEQEAYTLPAGVYNVQRVEVATQTGAPYYYQPYHGVWEEMNGSLYFKSGKEPADSGYILRLTYLGAHATMDADDDTISNYAHLDRLAWTAAVFAWRWRLQMAKQDEPLYTQFYSEAVARAEREKMKHPIARPIKGARMSL
jgi:hypothetical protein